MNRTPNCIAYVNTDKSHPNIRNHGARFSALTCMTTMLIPTNLSFGSSKTPLKVHLGGKLPESTEVSARPIQAAVAYTISLVAVVWMRMGYHL